MPDLRLGMDVSPLVLTRAGTARYVRTLVAALREAGADIAREYSFGGPSRATKIVRDVAWYLAALPLLARRDRLDVLHCPTIRAPVRSPVPLVVTIHDLAVLRHPETFNRWTRSWSRLTLPHVARGARRIVAVSDFTRRELVEVLGVDEERVRVVRNGVGPPFSPEGEVAEGEYILAVSTLEPRKNLARLVEGFRQAELGLELRVAGAPGWGHVPVEGEQVRLLGEVGDAELAALYRGAACVAYVSFYEGFGLPVLEALACGAPVVTARGGACEEVAAGAAELVDPFDPDDIAAGLRRAAGRRDELRALGLARARELTWERTARETLAVYEEAAAS
jgi:O-antigen biosynthesis alpha-1,2-mannosyltransferase